MIWQQRLLVKVKAASLVIIGTFWKVLTHVFDALAAVQPDYVLNHEDLLAVSIQSHSNNFSCALKAYRV